MANNSPVLTVAIICTIAIWAGFAGVTENAFSGYQRIRYNSEFCNNLWMSIWIRQLGKGLRVTFWRVLDKIRTTAEAVKIYDIVRFPWQPYLLLSKQFLFPWKEVRAASRWQDLSRVTWQIPLVWYRKPLFYTTTESIKLMQLLKFLKNRLK